MTEGQGAIRFADVQANLMRRWRVVAVVVVACVVIALALAYLLPRSYTATAVVTVNAINGNVDASADPTDVSMTTEQTLAHSRTVIEKAGARLHRDDDPRDLAEQVSITAPADAQVLQIDATAGSAKDAADLANAVAASYLQVRRTTVAKDVKAQLANVDKRIASLKRAGGKGKKASAKSANTNELSYLLERRSQLVTAPDDPGHVVTQALPPRTPSSPGPVIFGVGGLAAGLVAGVAVALVRERTDRRIRSADRLATIVGHNVIDFGPHADPDEVSNRIILRLGLNLDTPMTRVGVLGVDGTSARVLATHLVERLEDVGYDAVYATWSSAPAAPVSASGGKRRSESRVVLISASVEDSLSRAVSLSRNVDKIVVTTARSASVHDVEALLAELDDMDARVDALALVDTAGVFPATS